MTSPKKNILVSFGVMHLRNTHTWPSNRIDLPRPLFIKVETTPIIILLVQPLLFDTTIAFSKLKGLAFSLEPVFRHAEIWITCWSVRLVSFVPLKVVGISAVINLNNVPFLASITTLVAPKRFPSRFLPVITFMPIQSELELI